MIENIKANAEMVVQQMRSLSQMDFGYTRESVEWLQGYIERLRPSGMFDTPATRDKLASVFGSFLGECIVRCHGGVWTTHEGVWCIAFANNLAFPFTKVSKQMENGLDDSIGGLFDTVPLIMSGQVHVSPPQSGEPC